MTTFWKERPVLITGATGLLGGHLARVLYGRGAFVVCLVRDWVPESDLVRSGFLERLTVVRGDVCDQPLLERVLGEYQIDTVFHLAAQAIVGTANRNSVSTFQTNVLGTLSVLEASRRSSLVRQVVVASSDKAYGESDRLPYTEDTPLRGRHPYDASKACADLLAQSYAATFGVPVAISRCGNLFGPGDVNWNRLIPGTIRSALRGESPIIRSDGEFVRDYLFVEDGCEGYLRIAEGLAADRSLIGQAFNFSNEAPLAVKQVVDAILRRIDCRLSPRILNEATHEIRRQFLSAEKARRVLGWRPRFTFEEGLERTIPWYRDYLKDRESGSA